MNGAPDVIDAGVVDVGEIAGAEGAQARGAAWDRKVAALLARARARAADAWGWTRAQILAQVHTASARLDRASWRSLVARVLAPVTLDPGAALLALPLAIGLGATGYLGLDAEPPAWPAPLLAGLCAVAYVALRWRFERIWAARACLVAACLAGGFALTDLRTGSLAAPPLPAQDAPYEVEGWVEQVEAQTDARRRYVIRVSRLDGASADVPRRVRVGATASGVRPGDAVRLRTVLAPPEGPPTPGGYDFSRAAYFKGLAATGYALGAIRAAPDIVIEGRLARGRRLAAFRGRIADRLRAGAGAGAAGGVLAALVTGDRSEIPPEVTEALRAAGLGHILAISGLHLALVGGGAFFVLAWGLAAVEPLARRMNVRKLAAAGALAVSLGYLVISGAATPTARAFVMAAVAFGAILAERRALTQRGVAIAALIMLALAPESASQPGFQMSFAAVIALVAANDIARARRREEGAGARDVGAVAETRRFLARLSSTSLIAGLATAPFAAYHFNRIAVLGFAANLFAMPVFTVAVMPTAALAGALAPFGLEGAPAWVSGRAIEIVIAIAQRAADSPAALAPAPAAPPIALALATAALVTGAIVVKGRWRIALPLALAATLAWRAAPAEDLWLGEDGGWLARASGPEGVEWVGEIGRGESYGAELYQRRAGAEGAPITPPEQSSAFRCDAAGCAGLVGDRTVVVARRWSSVNADCAHADVVLTPGRAPARVRARCAGTTLIARRGRADRGAVLALSNGAPELVVARGASRPWRPAG